MKNFPLRNFLLLVGTCIWLALSCPPLLWAAASPPISDPTTAVQSFIGLDRHYDLSFLWHNHLAIGHLSFSRDHDEPKHYRARLEAKTLGVAAWLTGDRVQRYETLMEISPKGRLQPIEFKSMIYKKKGIAVSEQSKFYTFNTAAQTITVTRSKNGKKGSEQPIKLVNDHFPVDFLTAGFNFISGVDGPLRPGARKEIITFTSKEEQKIIIEVLGADNWPKNSFLKKGRGILLKITLPAEVLDIGGGAVYALLDEKSLPQRVIVENVLGLGDVRGELRP